MVHLQSVHRFWAPRRLRPRNVYNQLLESSPRRYHDSPFKPGHTEPPPADDDVLHLGPPSLAAEAESLSSPSSVAGSSAPSNANGSLASSSSPPLRTTSGLAAAAAASAGSEPSPTATEMPDSVVMQELLKQQQDQLQKEHELQEQEQALQEALHSSNKLRAFDLLSAVKHSKDSASPVTTSWADPASVAEATAAASTPAAEATAPSPATLVPIPAISTEEFKRRLGEWKCALDKKSRQLAQQADKNLTLLGLRVNEVTGYREVELLKEAVRNREREIERKRKDVREAKAAYETAVTTLSKTQQDVQSLLERKHTWSDQDVAHFTQLVRSDHASKNAVETTSEQLKAAELAVDKAFTALMQSILERYHEEQVWSDKIRSVSSWASLVVLGANLVVFVGAIAFVEPWKRKRLVEGLEQRMTGMMTKVDSQLQTLSDQVGSLESGRPRVHTAVPAVFNGVETSVGALPPAVDSSERIPTFTNDEEETAAAKARPKAVDNQATISPIYILERHFSNIPHGPQAFTWSMGALDKLAPPSAERDLAVTCALGAAAGAVTVGLVSIIASLIHH